MAYIEPVDMGVGGWVEALLYNQNKLLEPGQFKGEAHFISGSSTCQFPMGDNMKLTQVT